MELKWNVSFVKKYQENGTTESESVVPRQPTASPLEPATPFLPITSQPIASQPIASQPIASQPIASQPIASQPIVSQPIACPISMQQIVNPSSPTLKTSQRPTRMIRIPKQVEDYELSKALLAECLTAVPCLSCYGTEHDFFIQYLRLRSRFILDISLYSEKKKTKTKEGI